MSLIEKELADAHVYWSKKRAEGVEVVTIDRHIALISALLTYEQADRSRVEKAAVVRDVLEGTAEFNRGHVKALS